MTGHTPGPWHARQSINGYLIEAEPNVRIVRGSGGIKCEADANLAAAAPDLLEIVGRTVDRIDNLLAALKLPLRQDIHLQGLRSAPPEIREALNTAFVKAGGES